MVGATGFFSTRPRKGERISPFLRASVSRGSEAPPAPHSLPLPFESSLFAIYKTKNTPVWVCFSFGAEGGIRSRHGVRKGEEISPFLRVSGSRGSEAPPAPHSLPLPFESSLFAIYKTKNTPVWVCFSFGAEGGIRTLVWFPTN